MPQTSHHVVPYLIGLRIGQILVILIDILLNLTTAMYFCLYAYFMDHMYLEVCKRLCGFEFKCNSDRILHLLLGKDSSDETYNVVPNEECFQILTISGAEYPFKGYIKGLMEELGKLHRKNFLQIISYGDGASELKEWVERYRTDFLGINLKGETGYDEKNRWI